MTATSSAPTLGESWNRRLPDNSDCVPTQPMAQGRRLSPPSLAPLDLPRGEVLLVVDDAMMALDLQRLLHKAGYRVIGPATTVVEIQRILERGDIDYALLDRDVDRRAPLPIADVLAFADVPFVYLTGRTSGSLRVWHGGKPLVEKPFKPEALLQAIEKATTRSAEVANDNRWLGGAVVPWARVYPSL